MLDVEDGTVASLESVAEAIRRERPEIVTVVQGETSNTVWNHQLKEIAALAKAAGALVIVDAACTLSTMPLEMDAWGIDAVHYGRAEGFVVDPGVSLIAFSDGAWARVKGRRRRMRIGVLTLRWRRISGTTRAITIRRPCRACWLCMRRCGSCVRRRLRSVCAAFEVFGGAAGGDYCVGFAVVCAGALVV